MRGTVEPLWQSPSHLIFSPPDLPVMSMILKIRTKSPLPDFIPAVKRVVHLPRPGAFLAAAVEMASGVVTSVLGGKNSGMT